MTEAEWLAEGDPVRKLTTVPSKLTERKNRCFALACIRGIEHHFANPGSTEAVAVLERYVDGQASVQDLNMAAADAEAAWHDLRHDASEQRWYYASMYATEGILDALRPNSEGVAAVVSAHCGQVARLAGENEATSADRERRRQNDLIRDIVGNPFRPITFDPAWVTPTVRALAEGVYYRRASAPLPVLADALQDAGCEDAAILDHLRGPGPHVRGCWAVDLILGKS